MINYLLIVYNWLNANQLSLNLDKTVFITYGSYQNSLPIDIDIKIGNYSIKKVTNCKYLGIYFDCFLKWDIQILLTVKRTRYLLVVLRKMSVYMQKKVLSMIYFALFKNVAFY